MFCRAFSPTQQVAIFGLENCRSYGVICDALLAFFLLRLVLAICKWGPLADGLSFLGDNLASLNLALSGKSKGKLNALSRELALRVAREDIQFSVGHLPAEAYVRADMLSRLAQPGVAATIPPEMVGAAEVTLGPLSSFWFL